MTPPSPSSTWTRIRVRVKNRDWVGKVFRIRVWFYLTLHWSVTGRKYFPGLGLDYKIRFRVRVIVKDRVRVGMVVKVLQWRGNGQLQGNSQWLTVTDWF